MDFSYQRNQILELRKTNRVVVIDHHKTAQADLEGLDDCVFDMEHSGAVLAWQYFHKAKVPEILLYVEDRDLWNWELPDSRAISAWLNVTPFTVRKLGLAGIVAEYELHKAVAQGNILLIADRQKIERLSENVMIMRWGIT